MIIFIYIFLFFSGVVVGFYYFKYIIQRQTLPIHNIPELEEKEKVEEINKSEQISEQNDREEKYIKTIDNLYIVNELGRKVTSSLNLQQTFNHLYTTINSMMDAAVLELRVKDEVTGVNKLFTNIEKSDVNYINQMSDWCFTNNREVFLTDAEKDFARYVFQPLVLPDGRVAKSVIIFPIINRDIVSATLCVISFRNNSFSDYHREIILLLLGYISVAIENALRHEELNQTKIRAEKSEKFKEQFLANMSHEIRTPINAVTGMTSLLLEKHPRPDQMLYLESIRNASDSLLVIINDILDLSKIEAGKVELEKIDLSIFDIIKNVKEIMRFKAEEKGLAIVDHLDANIPPVLTGDPTRLTQILLNLIGNAIKFSEKGIVTVSVSRIHESNSKTVDNKSSSVSLLFEVSDTGIGMTEEQQRKLFQNYSQAGPETSRKYGGTGLGLSISRQLVNLLGGNIVVKSSQGLGSTFSFNIRFDSSSNTTVSVAERNISSEMLHELEGINILLADDNEYNRIVVKETLQLKIKDCTVDEAFDGLQAIEKIYNNNYDLVLMDLVMPQMDGLEATRHIRTKIPSPKNKIPIIALTASVVKREIDKCYESGMNGFIPKPFKNHDLINAIYQSFKKRNAVLENPALTNSEQKRKKHYTDMTYLREFTEGDEVRLKRYVDLFLTKTPGFLESLKKHNEKNDLEQVRIISHSMKSLLRSLGVWEGLELAEVIEQYSGQKINTADLKELISKLSFICEQAIDEIKLPGKNTIE
jgi:signal transduction histidine kinase/CheY-like chemotaxis protein